MGEGAMDRKEVGEGWTGPPGKPGTSRPPASCHLGLSAAPCRPHPPKLVGCPQHQVTPGRVQGPSPLSCPHGLHPPKHVRDLQTPIWLYIALFFQENEP